VLRKHSYADALDACAEVKPIYRRLLKMFLEELQLTEQQTQILRVATVSYPLKLILASDLNVGGYRRASLFVKHTLMKNDPDQATRPMGDNPMV
jgi:hypothetical protein